MAKAPRNLVDLHVHTAASDGALAPSQVVALAMERGLRFLCVTDHDTTEGLPEALAAAGAGLEVIPGVELSCDVPEGEVHIVGYYVDHHNGELQRLLGEMRHARRERALLMVAKLAALGLPVEWARVVELAGAGSVGRPHVAQALVARGYVASVTEAFNLYLGRNGPAYVERYKLAPAEAVSLIRRAGGLAGLAHPDTAGYGENLGQLPPLEVLLPELCAAGLVAIEAYYTGYTPENTNGLLAVAHRFGLIPTGGSDFHGGGVFPEAKLGAVFVPLSAVERLQALHRQIPVL